jgi:hypothetical protein
MIAQVDNDDVKKIIRICRTIIDGRNVRLLFELSLSFKYKRRRSINNY